MVTASDIENHQKELKDATDTLYTIQYYPEQEQKEARKVLIMRITELEKKIQNSSPEQKIQKYLTDLATPGFWADDLAIGALSESLNRPIVIIESSEAHGKPKIRFPIIGSEKTSQPIFVYYNGQNHYSALTVLPGYNNKAILEHLKQDKFQAQPIIISSQAKSTSSITNSQPQPRNNSKPSDTLSNN